MNSEGPLPLSGLITMERLPHFRKLQRIGCDPALCALVHKCAKMMHPSSVFDGLTTEESRVMRRKWIKDHVRNHHNLECTTGDMSLIGCPAYPIVNGQMTHVEKGPFSEHINLWHQPAVTAGKPSTS